MAARELIIRVRAPRAKAQSTTRPPNVLAKWGACLTEKWGSRWFSRRRRPGPAQRGRRGRCGDQMRDSVAGAAGAAHRLAVDGDHLPTVHQGRWPSRTRTRPRRPARSDLGRRRLRGSWTRPATGPSAAPGQQRPRRPGRPATRRSPRTSAPRPPSRRSPPPATTARAVAHPAPIPRIDHLTQRGQQSDGVRHHGHGSGRRRWHRRMWPVWLDGRLENHHQSHTGHIRLRRHTVSTTQNPRSSHDHPDVAHVARPRSVR